MANYRFFIIVIATFVGQFDASCVQKRSHDKA
jgi:hypothetical protein